MLSINILFVSLLLGNDRNILIFARCFNAIRFALESPEIFDLNRFFFELFCADNLESTALLPILGNPILSDP